MSSINLAISFLGVSKYNPVKYSHDKWSLETEYFSLFVAHAFAPSVLCILATEKARDTHYLRLESQLTKYKNENIINNSLELRLQLIPNCTNESELWNVFKVMLNALDIKSIDSTPARVLIDVTHGFRSQPIFAVAIAAYLKEVRNIDVTHLIYGALDAKNTEDDTVPVFDLTPVMHLLRLMGLARDLSKHGRGYDLAEEIGYLQNASWLKGDRSLTSLKPLRRHLRTFSDKMLLNRTKEVSQSASILHSALKAAKNDLSKIPPIQILLEDILKQLSSTFPFDSSGISNKVAQLRWHIEHRYYYNAVSIARELLVTYSAIVHNYSDNMAEEPNVRQALEGWLNKNIHKGHYAKNSVSSYYEYLESYNSDKSKLKRVLFPSSRKGVPDNSELESLLKLWSDISNLRNDLMHSQFGRKTEQVSASGVESFLSEALKYFEKGVFGCEDDRC